MERNDLGDKHNVKEKIWGFDSEFMMSGEADKPEDVHTVQFSDGKDCAVLESADQLKKWLLDHSRIKTVYGFVVLCDLGSVQEWLGEKAVKIWKLGTQMRGSITYGRADMQIFDAQQLLSGFGLRRLADCGQKIGFPKLDKPGFLGMRKWQTEAEYKQFIEYAKADAVITSRIVRWLIEKYGADPSNIVSAGTLASRYFHFPRRLKKLKNQVLLSPFEAMVKAYTFAGRSEGFVTGFSQNVVYNDVSSLYPCSMVATKTLVLRGFTPCKLGDLSISNDLSESRFGWIDGTFRSENDLWGLAIRGNRNYYMTGIVSGLYNTFDLAASKAEVLAVKRCFKPTFRDDLTAHQEYAKMLFKKLEGKYTPDEKGFYKAVLNAASGKLGQAKPISEKSNFLAYNTLLAHSHLIMSRLFDKCTSRILAMDTDSIFSQQNMEGKWFDVTDGELTFPIKIAVKGKGDLAFFRSKRYIVKGEIPCYAAHGWRYFLEDYQKMFEGNLTELDTRIDIKHTLMTRQFEALKMAKGRWRTRPQHLDFAKLKALLTADDKRVRLSYDSYNLVMKRQSLPSKAWNMDEYMTLDADILGVILHAPKFP